MVGCRQSDDAGKGARECREQKRAGGKMAPRCRSPIDPQSGLGDNQPQGCGAGQKCDAAAALESFSDTSLAAKASSAPRR